MLDLWFLPPIYPPFRKMCVQFHDLALRFFIGMLFNISCDFGEPRALDIYKKNSFWKVVIILQIPVMTTNIPWGKCHLQIFHGGSWFWKCHHYKFRLNLWPVFFETNFPQWAMWTSRFVRPDFGRHAFIDSDLDPVDRCKVVWLRGGGDEVMWIHSIFGLYIHYMYEEL